MKITSKLRIALKSILSLKMGEVATDKATLIWDNEGELAEGIEVFVKDENEEVVAAPDGDYTTEDGKVITVAEGKVASIKDPEAEVAPEDKPEETEMAEENPEVAPADEPAENVEPEVAPIEDRVAELEGKMGELVASLEQILNGIAALEGRISEVEAKVAKVEAEPAAEPAEDEPVEEEAHTRISYLRKNRK